MAKKRILLVDDEKAVRMLLVAALTYADYAVDAVENGVQAIENMNRISYDLVITDYIMPEMDGLELTKMIRSKYPSVPVLIITGTESAYNLLHREATACMIKPFDLFDLKKCVREIFNEKNPFDKPE